MLLQIFVSVLTLLCLGSQPALAATQGRIGSTSSGTITIRLTVHPNLHANLTHITETASQITSNTARFNQKESLCVRGNGIDRYSIAANGSGPRGQFYLASETENLHYDVNLWNGSQRTHNLSSSDTSQTLPIHSTLTDCSDSPQFFSVNLPSGTSIERPLKGNLVFTIMAE